MERIKPIKYVDYVDSPRPWDAGNRTNVSVEEDVEVVKKRLFGYRRDPHHQKN